MIDVNALRDKLKKSTAVIPAPAAPAPAPSATFFSSLSSSFTPHNEEAMPENLSQLLALSSALDAALKQEHPEIAGYLAQINSQLRQFPELTHLLSDEEIAPIYQGLIYNSGIQISVTNKPKSKARGKSDASVFDLL